MKLYLVQVSQQNTVVDHGFITVRAESLEDAKIAAINAANEGAIDWEGDLDILDSDEVEVNSVDELNEKQEII